MALSIFLAALTPTGLALVFLITIYLILSYYHLTPTGKKSQLPLPPGPRGLPIIGNLHQAPRQKAWEVYKQWSDQYGPIMTVNNGGNITIVVSSHHIVETFLAKHNALFSSRPQLLVLERALYGFTTPALPYGEKWLTHRALRGAVLKPTMAVKYRGINDLESKQLLHELLTKGDRFTECVRRQAASLFLGIAYGHRFPEETAEILDIDRAVAQLGGISESMFAGTAMLREFFPILKYLPGNDKFLKQLDDVGERLANIYVKRFRDGLSTPAWNWAKEYVSRPEAKGMSELELSFCIGSTYQASLTPYEILRIIVLAAIFHPEEMRRLQREIDAVAGPDRLPDWEHRDRIPWVMAFVYEALRWHAFSPLGAPRAISSDIEYNGYLLPKGATLVLNQWAMDHDENVYDDPFTFRPQRWIDNPNLPHVIFGFGLRGCPGQHLAREHLFINTARLFWAYDFGHAYENGKKVELDLDELMQPRGGGSAFNQVPSFPASVVIRSEKRKEIVEKAWDAVEKDEQKILAEVMPLKA
ncbi:hypothetical protein ASPACDRAFT_77104 [Aspergillus aculeatus ATCC 16872]|uniref:Cytochrome P450 n=1 Tax=Aspergillus aculeatus (strain ATCC 16872 / CBS 172.66 / WB 5094) TaxID=690307 RepID=A0A1L9WYQ2_ASPA1|nr:uncharacterized protein ASPACDRAFT_77104 [Aspergillus aculeatus ATCC 16872]OJK01331.1 hypothetical protein ASPACDRAFT_77104 [Aspergillus aculeatus ATCC 16872]